MKTIDQEDWSFFDTHTYTHTYTRTHTSTHTHTHKHTHTHTHTHTQKREIQNCFPWLTPKSVWHAKIFHVHTSLPEDEPQRVHTETTCNSSISIFA